MAYEGLEFVQLKQDHPDHDLRSGDCGVVWGVYGLRLDGSFTYEATFFGADGEGTDMMFFEDDVQLVEDVKLMPNASRLFEARAVFERAERSLADGSVKHQIEPGG